MDTALKITNEKKNDKNLLSKFTGNDFVELPKPCFVQYDRADK